MPELSKDDIIDQALRSIVCDHDLGTVVVLESGQAFQLPSVLCETIAAIDIPEDASVQDDPNFKHARVVDLLKPADLPDIDKEIQKSVKIQLSTGIVVSGMYWGAGPNIRKYEYKDLAATHQSFWAD